MKTSDSEELRLKFKDLLFRPVHIDHQNIEPDEITITKEGKEFYLDELEHIANQYCNRKIVEALESLIVGDYDDGIEWNDDGDYKLVRVSKIEEIINELREE